MTCGANSIVKDVVQVPSQVQRNIFSYLGQLSNPDLVVLLAERFFVASIEGKGKLKLFLLSLFKNNIGHMMLSARREPA